MRATNSLQATTRSGSPLSATVIPPKPPTIFIENSNSQTGNARNQTTLSTSPKPEQLHEYTIHTSTYSWLAGHHENSAYQTHCNIVGSASHPTSTKWRYACNAQMEPVTIYTQRAEPESNQKKGTLACQQRSALHCLVILRNGI